MSGSTNTPAAGAGADAQPQWPDNPTMKTYTGACHCRKFQFAAEHPVFEDGGFPVSSCNCSICAIKGLLFIYTTMDRFRFTSGSWEDATAYRFNTGVACHYFCPVCGVQFGGTGMGMVSVDVRTLEGVDVGRLALKSFDGKNLL